MLETVRARRIYGALVVLVVPASLALGVYLKSQAEETIQKEAMQDNADPQRVAMRLEMLQRRLRELGREKAAVQDKLDKSVAEGRLLRGDRVEHGSAETLSIFDCAPAILWTHQKPTDAYRAALRSALASELGGRDSALEEDWTDTQGS
ncbi:hypothetical protein MNV49_006004 [Pseudohyphozyma bogoriensis]|nr:hypothetical protein MNV49_006004 [Pseudohyphozyma bogoriensis]